jgi:Zn ribbon nucleic-acid-binding protein
MTQNNNLTKVKVLGSLKGYSDNSVVAIFCYECGFKADISTKVGRIRCSLATANWMDKCPGCGCTDCMKWIRKKDVPEEPNNNLGRLPRYGEDTFEEEM